MLQQILSKLEIPRKAPCPIVWGSAIDVDKNTRESPVPPEKKNKIMQDPEGGNT